MLSTNGQWLLRQTRTLCDWTMSEQMRSFVRVAGLTDTELHSFASTLNVKLSRRCAELPAHQQQPSDHSLKPRKFIARNVWPSVRVNCHKKGHDAFACWNYRRMDPNGKKLDLTCLYTVNSSCDMVEEAYFGQKRWVTSSPKNGWVHKSYGMLGWNRNHLGWCHSS